MVEGGVVPTGVVDMAKEEAVVVVVVEPRGMEHLPPPD